MLPEGVLRECRLFLKVVFLLQVDEEFGLILLRGVLQAALVHVHSALFHQKLDDFKPLAHNGEVDGCSPLLLFVSTSVIDIGTAFNKELHQGEMAFLGSQNQQRLVVKVLTIEYIKLLFLRELVEFYNEKKKKTNKSFLPFLSSPL